MRLKIIVEASLTYDPDAKMDILYGDDSHLMISNQGKLFVLEDKKDEEVIDAELVGEEDNA